MNENESARSRNVVRSAEAKPYIERIQHQPKPWIPEHGHIHRSLKFTFDPGDFVRDPQKIISSVINRSFDCLAGGNREGEVKPDNG